MMLMTVRAQVNSMVGKTFSNELANDIRQVVDETHESVRRISWDLMPGTLDRFGLAQTVLEMCGRLSGSNSIPVEFIEEGKPGLLDKNQEVHLYRIVQESVSNSLRHAQASSVKVRFRWEGNNLTISIEDDGTGFDFPLERKSVKAGQGLGLINLENRVALLGGQLHFKKNNSSGTIMKLKLPITHG